MGPVGQLKAMDAILKVWKGEDTDMEAKFVNPADGLRVAQVFASNAERYGAGNCGEHRGDSPPGVERRTAPVD